MVTSRDSEEGSLITRSKINTLRITDNPLHRLKIEKYSFLDDFLTGVDEIGNKKYFFINNSKKNIWYIILEQHMFEDHKLMLWDLYILPEHRQQGYAKEAVYRSIEHAKNSWYKTYVSKWSPNILDEKVETFDFKYNKDSWNIIFFDSTPDS